MAEDNIRITPIGGCGEFGKNLTLYIYKGAVYVVDCGVKFAEVWQPGIMGLIPNCDQVFAAYGAPTAYLLTHGHEDHIGAVPLFYEDWPAPIYTTAWTMELIKIKFEKYGLSFKQETHVVKGGDKLDFADGLSVEWLAMNHSIPMTCSLIISTPKLRIFHSGDFKFDPDPPYEQPTDVKGLQRLRPIDLMLVDSTNSASPGDSLSEKTVREPLRKYLSGDHPRIYITTFASNLWRLLQVIELAQELGKKVYACSRAIETSLEIGARLGLYDPERYRFSIITRTTSKIASNDAVVLVSGCQGERFSTLARVVSDRIRACALGADDLVIFSSRPIPGNELAIIKLCERIKERGAQVVSVREDRGIHVSGHAHSKDIENLIAALAPQTLMPVHGNFSHLDGVQKLEHNTKVVMPTNGDLFELDQEGVKSLAAEQFDDLYIDAESLVPLSFRTMKDRVRLGESGLCEIVGVIDKRNRNWLLSPHISNMTGVIESDGLEALCQRVKESVREQLHGTDFASQTIAQINDTVRVMFRRQVNLYVGKKTFVTSNIVEV